MDDLDVVRPIRDDRRWRMTELLNERSRGRSLRCGRMSRRTTPGNFSMSSRVSPDGRLERSAPMAGESFERCTVHPSRLC